MRLAFPRDVRSVHQIEITSRCNLRCLYCPSKDIVDGYYTDRLSMDMPREVYLRALEWVKFYVRTAGQSELNLAGIGESTMHPNFVEFVALAREAVGPNVKIVFATNGLIADEAMVKALVPYAPKVSVSLHRPEKAGIALELYRAAGLLEGISIDPSINANEWAGQVKWKIDAPGRMKCMWLREGKVMVMADGRFTTCCIDAAGAGVVGHVDDPIGSVQTKPYGLCATCHQEIDVEGYDQRSGVLSVLR